MEQISRQVVIKGHVQGVVFRSSCARVAERENVTGYAKNLPDGSVEVFMQGNTIAVENPLLWCHYGPRGARVDSVEACDVPPSDISDFTVL